MWHLIEPLGYLNHHRMLEKGIDAINKKTPNPYCIDTIKKSLQTGEYALFIHGFGEAFAIGRVIDDEYTGERTLFFWFMYSSAKRSGDVMVHYRDSFARLALELGCNKVQWMSKRPGYIKMPGVSIAQYTYEIAVPADYAERWDKGERC